VTSRQGGNRPGTTLLLWLVGAATLCCGIHLRARPLTGTRIDAAPLHYLIDINRAGEAQLLLLPGVGPTIARRIVAYRQVNGPYESIDTLHAVSGIGPKTVTRLRPFIRL
jgi:competence ComEA-like helix-hairpin-helix protein